MDRFGNNSKLNNKYQELLKAFESFSSLLNLDLNKYETEEEVDGMKNGQIQKFEYSTELFWKFLKSLLLDEKGINVSSPKDAIREYAPFSQLSPDEIRQLLEMIDDRNKIAHEYKDYIMEIIYPQIFSHATLQGKVIKNI